MMLAIKLLYLLPQFADRAIEPVSNLRFGYKGEARGRGLAYPAQGVGAKTDFRVSHCCYKASPVCNLVDQYESIDDTIV